MSLNLGLHEKKISERQFIGDLTNLFARYRISPRSACAFANFESRFALSEAFRSKLFTLCTAISHMSEADLTGEQLLMLIASALKATETSDVGPELSEWVREEFKDGYDAWSARDLTKADEWQIPHIQPLDGVGTRRKQAHPEFVEPVDRSERRPVHIDHDAFLARHPYLVPEQRVVPAARVSGNARPAIIPSAHPVHTVASDVTTTPPVRISQTATPPVEATGATIAGPYPRTARGLHRAQRASNFNPSAGRFWVSLRAAVGGIAASVSLVILAGGLGGIVLYPNAVADYFSQPSRVDPRMEKGAETRQFAANPQIVNPEMTNPQMTRSRANSRPSRTESAEDHPNRK